MIRLPLRSLSNPTVAIVAVGSNLGDRMWYMREAIAAIARLSSEPIVTSSIWRTEPEGCPPGVADFLNAVVAFVPFPDETPFSLLSKLLEIEVRLGRPKLRQKNQPRTVDLDLIAFGEEMITAPELVLPHPAACKRRFVLGPLSEFAPELVLPGCHKTVLELWNEL